MKTFREFYTEATDLESLKRKAPGSHTPAERKRLLDAGLDDFVRGGKTQSPVSDVAGLAATGLAVKAGLGGALSSGLGALSRLDMARKVFRNLRARGARQIRRGRDTGKTGTRRKLAAHDTDDDS
jgi:hypothetical protein